MRNKKKTNNNGKYFCSIILGYRTVKIRRYILFLSVIWKLIKLFRFTGVLIGIQKKINKNAKKKKFTTKIKIIKKKKLTTSQSYRTFLRIHCI